MVDPASDGAHITLALPRMQTPHMLSTGIFLKDAKWAADSLLQRCWLEGHSRYSARALAEFAGDWVCL